jgi:cholesterol transport system auxiliary component
MITRIRLVVATAVLATLAGCSTIVGKREPISIYAPEAAVQPDAAWPQVQWALQIPRPHASELLDSPRMVVRPSDGELQVYHGAVWAEPAPDLVQDAVLRAFEDSGRIDSVARRGSGVSGDFELLLDIRTFESDYAGGASPSAVVEIVAKLVANRSNTVVATRLLKQRVPASSTKIGDVSRAFDAALSAAVKDMVGWSLVEGQAYDKAHPAPVPPIKR